VGGRTVKWDGLSGERAADASYRDDFWQGGLQLGEKKYVAGCVRGRLDMHLLTPASIRPLTATLPFSRFCLSVFPTPPTSPPCCLCAVLRL
jgi:hypothetical protein